MISPDEIRRRVDRVTSYPVAERERIYHKYFTRPSSTVRFLCERYQLDQKRVFDVACHYGYHLVYFGKDSFGIDGSPQYLQFGREMGLSVQACNIEEGLPEVSGAFDAIFFSGTLEEILAPHVILMRFRSYLKPDGLLCLRVPTVPPAWFDRLLRLRRIQPGYDAEAHLYFFTPRLLRKMLQRAGYDVVDIVSAGLWAKPVLRPFQDLMLPLAITVTIVARVRPDFKYPPIRAMRFLPGWAADLGPYHQDYQPGRDPLVTA